VIDVIVVPYRVWPEAIFFEFLRGLGEDFALALPDRPEQKEEEDGQSAEGRLYTEPQQKSGKARQKLPSARSLRICGIKMG
jgi:hypothetical protein